MAEALLLTGRPGVGKTTAIRAVLAHLGVLAGGFYTEEVREQGRRTGFRLVALVAGSTTVGTLASVNSRSRHRVSRYGVCIGDLERIGVAALQRATERPDIAVVVVDEIGKMELFSQAFRAAVISALDSPKPVIATVMSQPEPWVDSIKRRPDVTLVEITPSNRQSVPQQVIRWLSQDRAFPAQLQAQKMGEFCSKKVEYFDRR